MGLLSADLEVHRAKISKTVQENLFVKTSKDNPLENLRTALELYRGTESSLEKAGSEGEYPRLWERHRAVEAAYRQTAKIGRRLEADAVLDKFAGWSYLKGAPAEPGDLKPLPGPDGK